MLIHDHYFATKYFPATREAFGNANSDTGNVFAFEVVMVHICCAFLLKALKETTRSSLNTDVTKDSLLA